MRFKKYITENKLLDEISIEEMAKKFKKNCKPFFRDFYRIWKGDFFLSGRTSNELFDRKPVRKNRKPLDTSKHYHNIIDNWFHDNFGIWARSETIFCTFKVGTAANYGDPYYIIPIGKYTTIASGIITDVFGDIIDGYLPINSDVEENEEYIIKELDSAEYKRNKKVKNFYTEYMVHCKEYYMIDMYNFNDDIQEKVLTEMGINL